MIQKTPVDDDWSFFAICGVNTKNEMQSMCEQTPPRMRINISNPLDMFPKQ